MILSYRVDRDGIDKECVLGVVCVHSGSLSELHERLARMVAVESVNANAAIL